MIEIIRKGFRFVFSIFFIILLFMFFMSLVNTTLYEVNVYDCSNMVTEQEDFFNKWGIETSVAIAYEFEEGDESGHAWLFLHINDKKIPFESTSFSPFIKPQDLEKYNNPDEEWSSVQMMLSVHPDWTEDFRIVNQVEKKAILNNRFSGIEMEKVGQNYF